MFFDLLYKTQSIQKKKKQNETKYNNAIHRIQSLYENLLFSFEIGSSDKYMASSVIANGNINSRDMKYAMTKLKHKKTVQFAEWCPGGTKFILF